MTKEQLQADLVEKIHDAHRRDSVITASLLLDMLLSFCDGSEYHQYLYGDLLRATGRPDKAKPILLRLRGKATGRMLHMAELGLARLFGNLGQFSDAEESYERAIRAQPTTTVGYAFAGEFAYRQEKLDEAIEIFNRGLSAEGDIDELHLNLGKCFSAKGDLEHARRHFEAALAIDPHFEETITALADIETAIAVMRVRKTLTGVDR